MTENKNEKRRKDAANNIKPDYTFHA